MDAAGNLWTVSQGSKKAYLLESGLPTFSDVPWLTVRPGRDEIMPGHHSDLEIRIDTESVPPGLHRAFVVVTTNDPDRGAITIPIRLNVTKYRRFVNVGGEAVTFGDGTSYVADRRFTDGGFGYVGDSLSWRVDHAIEDTRYQSVFRSQRYGMSGYRFSVPDGRYEVTLEFAELTAGVGEFGRIMDIYAQGDLVLNNLDVAARVGRNHALTRTFDVQVRNGMLRLRFDRAHGKPPMLNGVRVTWLPGGASSVNVERLMRLPLFGELDHHDLSHIAARVNEVELAAGDVLIEQGSMPYDVFVLEEGTVEVVRDGQQVATLGAGEVVGEMGLIDLTRAHGHRPGDVAGPGGGLEGRRPRGDGGTDARGGGAAPRDRRQASPGARGTRRGLIAGVAKTVDQLLDEARARFERIDPSRPPPSTRPGRCWSMSDQAELRREHGAIPGALVIGLNVLEWHADPASAVARSGVRRPRRARDPDLSGGVQLEPRREPPAGSRTSSCDRCDRRCRRLARCRAAAGGDRGLRLRNTAESRCRGVAQTRYPSLTQWPP